jgi:hypothetical protein
MMILSRKPERFVYPQFPLPIPDGWANFHLGWAAISLGIIALDPGALSLDRFGRRLRSEELRNTRDKASQGFS